MADKQYTLTDDEQAVMDAYRAYVVAKAAYKAAKADEEAKAKAKDTALVEVTAKKDALRKVFD